MVAQVPEPVGGVAFRITSASPSLYQQVKRLILTLVILVVIAGRAIAQPTEPTLSRPSDPEAARLYREGNDHYKVREYEQAITSYTASIKIEESQAALYNIAQSHRKLGHFEDAISFYNRVIDSASLVGPQRDRVEGLLATMRDELDRKRADAGLLVEDLKRAPVAPAPEPVEQGVADEPAHEPTQEGVADEPTPERSARWYDDTLGWTLVGGGAALGGVAIGLAISGEHAQLDANREPAELAREQLQTRADSRRTWSAITGVAGAAIAVTGIVLLALPPRDGDVVVALGAQGITVAGRF